MEKRRLFFALWPNESARSELVKKLAPIITEFRRNRPDVRPNRPEDLHLTLAFIGAATETYRACLSQAARKASESDSAQPFSLDIDRLGYFDKGKVLWAGCQLCPESLPSLQTTLVKALAGCGYEAEPRIFKPHITLMRKAVPPQNLPTFTPVSWQVNGFCLAESLPVSEGRRYRVIEEFKFAV